MFLVLWTLLCKGSSEHGVVHVTPQEKFGGIMSGHLGGRPVGSSESLQLPGILCINFLRHSGITSFWKYAVGKDSMSVARCRFLAC